MSGRRSTRPADAGVIGPVVFGLTSTVFFLAVMLVWIEVMAIPLSSIASGDSAGRVMSAA